MDRNAAAEWLRYAQMDYETVHVLVNADPLQMQIICYHCQQCMEKLLKSFLAYHTKVIARTHSLRQLNQACEALESSFGSYARECIVVSQYATVTRYPYEAADEITYNDMQSAIYAMEKLWEHVRGIVDK